MNVHDLSDFINRFLNIYRFNDYAINGIQVEANDKVSKIALGVSASLALFEKSKQIKADAVIVHHGLFWKGNDLALTDVMAKRVKFLFNNHINLLAYHLPLDAHELTGNNACLSKKLSLTKLKMFAKHGGEEIGYIGEFNKAHDFISLEKKLEKEIGSIKEKYYFGNRLIKKAAVGSGGAASDVYEAKAKGADIFITGEVKEPTQEWCREAQMNFISMGHYSSERLGIQALGKIIKTKFKINCEFIEIPNNN